MLKNASSMTVLRRSALLAVTAPLALALAACGEEAKEEGLPQSEPIAAIAAPAGTSWTETIRRTDDGGYVMGNPDAPLKLIEYASLSCSHCAHFSEESEPTLKEKYISSGVVSYEIRMAILNPLDVALTAVAECNGPEAFFPLAEQTWANQNLFFDAVQANKEGYAAAMGKDGAERFPALAKVAGITEFFAARGISTDQANQCLSDMDKLTATLNQIEELSKRDEIRGTPTFFLNGRRLDVTAWEAVEPILQNAGAR